jgi:hypothetical protein
MQQQIQYYVQIDGEFEDRDIHIFETKLNARLFISQKIIDHMRIYIKTKNLDKNLKTYPEYDKAMNLINNKDTIGSYLYDTFYHIKEKNVVIV